VYIDTHCHLDDESFAEDLSQVLSRAAEARVEAMIAIGTTADSSQAVVRLAQTHAPLGVYSAVGIQPNYAGAALASDWDRIVALAAEPRVVALGETGLDRYWDHTPFDVQQDYFDRHLRLSAERKLPVVIHTRDCDADILESLRTAHARSGPLLGVMHSFTGAAETAAQCVAMGLYISFAGMVTYKKSQALRDVAVGVPAERLLIETDSPYLSPHPFRGQRRNEPALVIHTAACLAEARATSVEELARQTTANARRLFVLG